MMTPHTTRYRLFMAVSVLALLPLVGCSSARNMAGSYQDEASVREYPSASMQRAAPAPLAKGSAPAEAEALQDAGAGPHAASTPESAEDSAGAEASVTPEARKRIYSGSAEILTDRPEELKQEIIQAAERSGGYLESVWNLQIVLRIPAARFEEVFAYILSTGDVLDRSVETWDVTDQFTDLSIRLDVSSKARERLYALLEKTDDVKERIRILREIKRLSDEIERLETTLSLMESHIAYSRISVELVPRLEADISSGPDIPFAWIADLHPLYGRIPSLAGTVNLDLGDEFAVFRKDPTYRAEAPDGTRVRIATTANRPAGTSAFWQKAILHHQGRYYRSAVALEYGPVKGVLFTSKDAKPFVYFVGVTAAGPDLHVVEVFFPGEASRTAYGERLAGALAQLEVGK